MSWTNLKLGNYWDHTLPDYVDVISPRGEHITYVPLMPWDGEKYHCIHCGAEIHGYLHRCSCGRKIYGYEDNGVRAVLDACEVDNG